MTKAGASLKATLLSFEAIAGSAKDQLVACFVSEALKATISLVMSRFLDDDSSLEVS